LLCKRNSLWIFCIMKSSFFQIRRQSGQIQKDCEDWLSIWIRIHFSNQNFWPKKCAGLNWLIRIWWGHETELQHHPTWKLYSPPRAFFLYEIPLNFHFVMPDAGCRMLLKPGNIRPIRRLITRSRWDLFSRILEDGTEKKGVNSWMGLLWALIAGIWNWFGWVGRRVRFSNDNMISWVSCVKKTVDFCLKYDTDRLIF
jgi:hypothetical protein